MIRLDKYLADLGIGTRSQVKAYLKKGQVAVNGRVEKQPDRKVDETKDLVSFQGSPIPYVAFEYYMLNKPAGCVSATEDNFHKTVLEYITGAVRKDLFPVGRLDKDTEGLLFITNDGVLCHDLLAPGKHVPKTYFASIQGEVTPEDASCFAQGVEIGEKKLTKPAILEIISTGPESEVILTVTEGKFHQVKRMFEAVNKKVLYLKRISMGGIALDKNLKPGDYRPLTRQEIELLKNNG